MIELGSHLGQVRESDGSVPISLEQCGDYSSARTIGHVADVDPAVAIGVESLEHGRVDLELLAGALLQPIHHGATRERQSMLLPRSSGWVHGGAYEGGQVVKTVSVAGNPFGHLHVRPWLEDRTLVSTTTAGYVLDATPGHASWHFTGAAALDGVTIELRLAL